MQQPSASREKKRQSYRKSLTSLSPILSEMDVLLEFDLPEILKEHRKELAHDSNKIKERVKSIIALEETVQNDLERSNVFVDQMHEITTEQSKICKRAREASFALCENQHIDKKTRKSLIQDLNEKEKLILQQRSCLTKNKLRVSSRMISHTSETRMSEAYFTSILHKTEWPADAQRKQSDYYGSGRSSSQNSDFRMMLISTYTDPVQARDESSGDPKIWCPISQQMILPLLTTAAHIVPVSIAQHDIEYLWGCELHSDEGYTTLWGPENGLLLHTSIEKALDKSQIVIVPTGDPKEREYEVIVLSEELKSSSIQGCTVLKNGVESVLKFSDIHHRTLQWFNKARPGPTNLFLRYMISRWMRKWADVKNWEEDVDKIPWKGQWPGARTFSHGVMHKVAWELGDTITISRASSGTSTSSILEENESMLSKNVSEEQQHEGHLATRLASAVVSAEDD